MTEMAQAVPAGSHGVSYSTHRLRVAARRSPAPNLTGAFMGLTLRNTRADLLRAPVMERASRAFRCAARWTSCPVRCNYPIQCSCAGGGSRSRLWRQNICRCVSHAHCEDQHRPKRRFAGRSSRAGGKTPAACGSGYDTIPACHQQEDISTPDEATAAMYERRWLPLYKGMDWPHSPISRTSWRPSPSAAQACARATRAGRWSCSRQEMRCTNKRIASNTFFPF